MSIWAATVTWHLSSFHPDVVGRAAGSQQPAWWRLVSLMSLFLCVSDGFSVRSAAAERGRLRSAGSAAVLQPSAAAARRPEPAALHAAPPTATTGEPTSCPISCLCFQHKHSLILSFWSTSFPVNDTEHFLQMFHNKSPIKWDKIVKVYINSSSTTTRRWDEGGFLIECRFRYF